MLGQLLIFFIDDQSVRDFFLSSAFPFHSVTVAAYHPAQITPGRNLSQMQTYSMRLHQYPSQKTYEKHWFKWVAVSQPTRSAHQFSWKQTAKSNGRYM